MATRRARSDEDKLARRAEILDAAREVFDRGEVDAFTMDDVAAALELAKGTLYRYFPTREGLLLALADDEYQQWFARVDQALVASDLNASHVGAFAQLLVDQTLCQPRFLRLAALVPSVLERNVPYDTARQYKCNLVERGRRTTALLAQRMGVSDDKATQLLVHLQAAATGLYHAANPAPIIVQLMADPTFPGRRTDLRIELLHSARALVWAASL